MREMLTVILGGLARVFRRDGGDDIGAQLGGRRVFRESGYMAGYAGIIDFMKEGGRK